MFEKGDKEEKTSFPYNKILYKQQQWKQRERSSKMGGAAFGPEGDQCTQGRPDMVAFTWVVERCAFLFFNYSFILGCARLLSSYNEQRLLSGSASRHLIVVASLLTERGSRARGLPCLWDRGSGAPWHMESSWTRAGTCVPCIGRWILLHWTTREVQVYRLINVGEKIKHASSYFFHQKFWKFWEG